MTKSAQRSPIMMLGALVLPDTIRGMMLAVLAILAQGASGAAMPHAPHQGHHYGAAHEDAGSTMHVEPSHLASDEADEHPDGSS